MSQLQQAPVPVPVPAAIQNTEIDEWRQASAAPSESELTVPASPKTRAFLASVEDLDMFTKPAKRPRWWRRWFSGGTLRFVATYMALPFVTGVMAGMGEIFANELMFRWGWQGARPIMVAGRNNRALPVIREKPTAARPLDQ
ncbi:hypothetical protein IWW50_006919 [Coemansia erecta]|nr:hypothetical protein GGF43_006717 [Coemansia sp. RSA 2618]KAJ2815116.1 hypothetical protein IWW50_006919 [Coemansia erecta]